MSRAPRPGREDGFVLVGVVMMVLALTIIGLSLYSLSGYESQFFIRSLSARQALYRASGGIEIVKKLVITPLGSPAATRLSNAALAVGRENIVSALAWQENPNDSSGPLDWSRDVHIRVGVNVNGVTRTVRGTYSLSQPNNPYWRLFTAPGGIAYDAAADRGTLRARGGAWHPVRQPQDSAWIRQLESESRVALTTGTTPSPVSAAYITTYYPASPTSPDTAWLSRDFNPFPTYTTLTMDMDAGAAAGSYRYFRSATDLWTVYRPNLPYFDFYTIANVTVRVRGTAIWIVPAGLYVEGEFRVQRMTGASEANLIIVAGPNNRFAADPGAGAIFDKGIETPLDDANVFVVSHGAVRIRDRSQAEDDMRVRNLCVFANAITLGGPDDDTHRLEFNYRPEFRAVADDLYGRGLLPAATGVRTSAFTFRPGTWTESPGLQ